MERLPSDIVMDILSRLPVKSIMFCRCVSKPLLNLTHDPRFLKLHLNRSTFQENSNLIVSRMFFLGDPNNRMYFLEYDDSQHDYTCSDVNFSHSQPNFEEFRVMGSCNGLLCLVESENLDGSPNPIYVCNPFTRQFVKLPDPFDYSSDTAVGFGFSPNTDKYKVVAVRNYDDYSGMVGWGAVCVFTLGDTSWRGMGNSPCLAHSSLSPKHVFVNGALHWYSRPPVNVIVSFDITDEVVQMIDPPNVGQCFSLGVLSECLSVSGFVYGGHAEIWIMKEYGVKESWNKCYDINFSEVGRNIGYIRTVCLQKDGELLLLYRHGELVSYNLRTLNLRKINIAGPSPWFEAVTHVPSLVSPLNYTLKEKQVRVECACACMGKDGVS